jgi:hypothetical protein
LFSGQPRRHGRQQKMEWLDVHRATTARNRLKGRALVQGQVAAYQRAGCRRSFGTLRDRKRVRNVAAEARPI